MKILMFSYIEVASSLTQEIILPLRGKTATGVFSHFEPLQSYLFRHSRLEMRSDQYQCLKGLLSGVNTGLTEVVHLEETVFVQGKRPF